MISDKKSPRVLTLYVLLAGNLTYYSEVKSSLYTFVTHKLTQLDRLNFIILCRLFNAIYCEISAYLFMQSHNHCSSAAAVRTLYI